MNNTNTIVKKSNDIIDQARYQLTVPEQRLILLAISKINVKDTDMKTYDIPVSELMEKSGKSDWLYHELKQEACNLLKKPVFFRTSGNGWLAVNWFSSLEYVPGTGIMRVQFSPKLKPYLLQLRGHFTQYPLEYVLSMHSLYSIRVYELLKMRQAFGRRYFDLQEFKALLGLDTKPAYELYGNVKHRILLPAAAEIHKCTDLQIYGLEEKKNRSRAVVGFTLCFGRKPGSRKYTRKHVDLQLTHSESDEERTARIDDKERRTLEDLWWTARGRDQKKRMSSRELALVGETASAVVHVEYPELSENDIVRKMVVDREMERILKTALGKIGVFPPSDIEALRSFQRQLEAEMEAELEAALSDLLATHPKRNTLEPEVEEEKPVLTSLN
jgi:plasmid replication initiation protein